MIFKVMIHLLVLYNIWTNLLLMKKHFQKTLNKMYTQPQTNLYKKRVKKPYNSKNKEINHQILFGNNLIITTQIKS